MKRTKLKKFELIKSSIEVGKFHWKFPTSLKISNFIFRFQNIFISKLSLETCQFQTCLELTNFAIFPTTLSIYVKAVDMLATKIQLQTRDERPRVPDVFRVQKYLVCVSGHLCCRHSLLALIRRRMKNDEISFSYLGNFEMIIKSCQRWTLKKGWSVFWKSDSLYKGP